MNMKNAKDRQYLILEAMKEGGSITAEQAKAAFAEVLEFQPMSSEQQEGFAPYFRDYIRYLSVGKLGIDEKLLNEGGITIYTTLDQDIQAAAEESIKQGLPAKSEQQAALVAIELPGQATSKRWWAAAIIMLTNITAYSPARGSQARPSSPSSI